MKVTVNGRRLEIKRARKLSSYGRARRLLAVALYRVRLAPHVPSSWTVAAWYVERRGPVVSWRLRTVRECL